MSRRGLRVFVGIVALLILTVAQAVACEFKFDVVGEEKDSYSKGDQLVVKVTVIYTHRVCPEGIDATKFNFSGVKALGATKWKQIAEGKYERKFKLEVTESKKDKYFLNAVRTCDKDGGNGTFMLKVN